MTGNQLGQMGCIEHTDAGNLTCNPQPVSRSHLDRPLLSRNPSCSTDYGLIMKIVWKRLAEDADNWRHVYKGLNLLEYLVRNGSERIVDDCRDHMFQLRALADFKFVDESGNDQGINGVPSLLRYLND